MRGWSDSEILDERGGNIQRQESPHARARAAYLYLYNIISELKKCIRERQRKRGRKGAGSEMTLEGVLEAAERTSVGVTD